MPATPPLDLFPRPRHLEQRGDGPPSSTPATEQLVGVGGGDGRLPAEGFEIELDPDTVVVRHADASGRRYARAVLDQLRAQCPDRLPGLLIRDWPDIPARGYMLDISRDRVPTRATLDRIVELMALARINQLQLYTEHTFAYRDHATVWSAASPITPDDIAWLQSRCAEAGIELVPNQNCFGHMERWLRHDAYRHRAETPAGFELLPGLQRPPAVLAPTADNAAFALGLLDELLPLFDSRRVNIGCDETFELGKGASRDEVERRGVTRVYIDHVKRIAGPLAERGYEVQIWADMLRRDPSLFAELPDAVVPVVWTYEAPRPDGAVADVPADIVATLADAGIDLLAHSGFATNVAPLAEAGVPFWVAPGTSSWASLVGRVDNASANLLDAAEVAVASGAAGYLINDWGDDGHLQPPSVSFGPLLLGGAVSWCLAANRDLADDLPAVLDRWVFGDPAGPDPGSGSASGSAPGASLGCTIDELGRLWRRTGQRAFNSSPLQAALAPGTLMVTGEPDAAKVGATIERLDAALATLDRSTPAAPDGAMVRKELTAAVRLARHGAYRLLAQAGGPAPAPAALKADLAEAIDQQSAAWLARSRSGGLADSLSRLRTTLATYG
jgi:hypothetical protein